MSAEILFERFARMAGGGNAPRGCVIASVVAASLAAAAVGGCASEPKPTAELVRASTLVSEAEKNQAQHYAAADLQRARDELSGAQTAASDGKYDNARRLADRAAADADLASARAASGQSEQSAEQVHRSLDTLRQQLQQSPAPSEDTGPGSGGPGQDHP